MIEAIANTALGILITILITMQIFPCQVAPFGVMPKDNHMVGVALHTTTIYDFRLDLLLRGIEAY